MKRYIEAWDGPRAVTCSTCGLDVPNGLQLTRFDTRERATVEWLNQFTCTDCMSARYARHKADRKAQLDAMPRCEVPNCKTRGTLIVAGSVRMCRRHLNRANARNDARGIFGMFATANPTREDIIRLAT